MIEWVKNNPIKLLLLVVLFVVLYSYMSSGSSSSTSTSTTTAGYDPNTVAAGMQLQSQQLEQQGRLAALQTAAGAQADQTAAAIQIAMLQAQTVQQQNVLGAQVAVHSLDVQSDIAASSNSLQASIAASNNATTAQIAAMTQATNQLVITSQTQQAQINADVSKTYIGATTTQAQINADVSKAYIGASTAQAKIKASPCFVTTACCSAMGLPDDCYELTMLRRLRDEYVAGLPDGAVIMLEYADRSVAMIAAMDERGIGAWHQLHAEFIKPAADLVAAGDLSGAFALYERMVLK